MTTIKVTCLYCTGVQYVTLSTGVGHILSMKITSVLINLCPPTFCLCFVFAGINFRGMLHHVCNVAYDENVWTNQNS